MVLLFHKKFSKKADQLPSQRDFVLHKVQKHCFMEILTVEIEIHRLKYSWFLVENSMFPNQKK